MVYNWIVNNIKVKLKRKIGWNDNEFYLVEIFCKKKQCMGYAEYGAI